MALRCCAQHPWRRPSGCMLPLPSASQYETCTSSHDSCLLQFRHQDTQQSVLLTCFLDHSVSVTKGVQPTLFGYLGIHKHLNNDREAGKLKGRIAGNIWAFDKRFRKRPERGRAAAHL